MSKIDYQVLREAAVAIETVATPQKLLAFRMKVTPQVVLALLDERDALNERLAELEADLAGLAEDHQKATESIKQADAAVKLAHEKFSALAAENAMLKQRTQQLIDIISNTDNDYCMCGSAMKDHVHSGCGYPTGMFDYYYNQWLESDNKTPATDAFLAEVRAQGVTEYSSKRGFSFQHGSIHAHFGTGDVMVGSVTFENGDAGINFAPVREKTGGVGTHYEWTKGKTAEQVDSVFVIASSNAEGLEVIRDKLSEAIAQLRKGVQS
nr:ead/Ea22-like family protein [Escherichia coli]